jgi:hypothetical protein
MFTFASKEWENQTYLDQSESRIQETPFQLGENRLTFLRKNDAKEEI